MVEELTDRELAVLRYLPSQLSQREIASELYVSLNTVKTHCKAIYRKLGVDGRKAAVQAARDHGLL
jgi:LuxR family maltose regulon positive regulatory protein